MQLEKWKKLFKILLSLIILDYFSTLRATLSADFREVNPLLNFLNEYIKNIQLTLTIKTIFSILMLYLLFILIKKIKSNEKAEKIAYYSIVLLIIFYFIIVASNIFQIIFVQYI